jgi:hypothetical protein
MNTVKPFKTEFFRDRLKVRSTILFTLLVRE